LPVGGRWPVPRNRSANSLPLSFSSLVTQKGAAFWRRCGKPWAHAADLGEHLRVEPAGGAVLPAAPRAHGGLAHAVAARQLRGRPRRLTQLLTDGRGATGVLVRVDWHRGRLALASGWWRSARLLPGAARRRGRLRSHSGFPGSAVLQHLPGSEQSVASSGDINTRGGRPISLI
jgi:hypothetical protein